jgi:NAD(P)-dependent dehydrogenase (short-subunit alcohol dehydrogenase family)
MFELRYTVAIVTGAGRGNGNAIARGLCQAGAIVQGVDRAFPTEDPFTQITGDVTDRETIDSVRDRLALIEFNHLVLVNNAGVTYPNEGPYLEESWRRTLEINLTAPFLWIEAFADLFRATKSGSIINMTSLSAERAFPNNPAYTASKGGLKMLGKHYAKTFGADGVRVNNVGPGYLVTDMTRESYDNPEIREARARHTFPGRWGVPEDLVGLCVFLAGPASSYITGQDIYVDGGWTANGLLL